MTTIRSVLLWTVGTAFFGFTFVVLYIGLYVLSRDQVFSVARYLFSIQTKLMGIRLKVTGLANIDKKKTYNRTSSSTRLQHSFHRNKVSKTAPVVVSSSPEFPKKIN